MSVVFTGLGAVTPLGEDLASSLDAARAGTIGSRPIPMFEGTPFEGRLGGAIARSAGSRGELAIAFARAAIRDALTESRVSLANARAVLVVGTSTTPESPLVSELVRVLRDELGGLTTLVVSTACISGLSAMSLGKTLLAAGAFDVVVAGGTDEISLTSFAGFHSLGLLDREPVRPFLASKGTNLGEGAAFAVLERAEDARARGAVIVGVLEGVGHTSDAHHATSPHPSGDGVVRAAGIALREAGLEADGVGWVSAHGTGTRANDEAERLALATLFGARVAEVPVTVTKSLVGHSLGAASAVELVLGLGAMRRGEMLPSAPTLSSANGAAGLRLITTPEPATDAPLLKIGAGFGGLNGAAVVRAGDAAASPRAPRPRRAIAVLGMGGFGGLDAQLDPMGRVPTLREDAGSFDLESLTRGIQARGMDRTAQMLAAACHRAARSASIDLAGPRTGTFVGQRRASPENGRAFEDSVAANGHERVSGSAFTRRVLNTATGAVSRVMSLKGATFTISTGVGSGMAAVALAAEHLVQHDDLDHALAAAVDERDLEAPRAVLDGAACLLLGAGPSTVELSAWALGATPLDALEAARARCGAGPLEVVTVAEDTTTPAVSGLFACGLAVRSIVSGALSQVAVVERGTLASACLIFRRSQEVT